MACLCSKTKHKALDNVMSVESVPWEGGIAWMSLLNKTGNICNRAVNKASTK